MTSLFCHSRPMLIAATALAGVSGHAAPRPVAQDGIRIARDHYGVPHIHARSRPALYYGLGYAIGQDRLFQMEMMRRSVWGEVAEILGPSFVDFDRETRQRGYSRAEVSARLAALKPSERVLFAAYADGLNAWIAKGRLPNRFAELGFTPKPWTAEDLAQIFIGNVAVRFTDKTQELDNAAMLEQLTAQFGAVRGRAIFDDLVPLDEDPAAVTSLAAGDWTGKSLRALSVVGQPRGAANGPGVVAAAEGVGKADAMLGAKMASLALNDHGGSNVWVVGKDKSATGYPLLMGGPQMGFTMPGFLYEAGLHGGGMDVVGATPIGFIPIFFGHNGNSAWSSTVGRGDAVDTFVERLDPADPTRYFHKGRWRAMAARTETIRVRGAAPVTATFYRTVHGPVLKVDVDNHRAYTRARAWEGHELDTEMAWFDSTLAQDFGQFHKAALRSAISINWWYADRQGNIGMVYPGRFPIRSGDQDPRLPSDGTGGRDWSGFLSSSRQPYRLNPSRGFFTNWNQQPVKGWYFPDTGWSSVERARLLQDFMQAHDKVSVADMEELNHVASTMSQTAGFFLPGLIAAIEQKAPEDRQLRQARDLLAGWDRRRIDADGDGRYDSPALVIYDAWLTAMTDRVFGPDIVGQPLSKALRYRRSDTYDIGRGPKLLARILAGTAASLPVRADYLAGQDAASVQVDVLRKVLAQLGADRGGDMARWSDPILFTRFATANAHNVPQGVREPEIVPLAERGTQNHLVELRPTGAVGRNVVAPGQAEEAGDHVRDQVGLFRDFQYKPMRFLPQEISQDTEKTEVLVDPYRP
ncbi:penicillin acylase family protein [Sphingobium sp. CAP-1]|uniref:penicillin acylase family protein n=1 Tax=Sphingobium sp. CAP-1 TaxID=2676077 RepID=UPI0018AD121C|nr:penicillin acylase family protein [Sphingobium sp. CAP-1]